ncbi:hypothetical protein [Telmatospirillum sp. J64-1]|nr:hypothetical protein [Telmatospirillum sp. J64-1]
MGSEIAIIAGLVAIALALKIGFVLWIRQRMREDEARRRAAEEGSIPS